MLGQHVQNAGFEVGQPTNSLQPDKWGGGKSESYVLRLDSTVAKNGKRSLKIASTVDSPKGFFGFTQACTVQVARPTAMHLRVAVKTENIASVALWCQSWDDKKMIGFANSQSQGNRASGTGEWKEIDLILLVKPEIKRFVFGGYLGGKGQAWFDDVRFDINEAESSANVKTYLQEAIAIVQKNALVRDSVSWTQTKADLLAFAGGMQTEQEAHSLIRYLLSTLRQYGDNHSFFQSPAAAKSYNAEQPAKEVPQPQAKYFNEGIGYVLVPGFESTNKTRMTNFATQIQRLIHSVDDQHPTSGWIVDLRQNQGGNMYPMIAGLGPLLGEGTLGHFVTDKQSIPWGYQNGEAYALKPGNGTRVDTVYRISHENVRIAVLVGAQTASSGEMTAVSFIGRPNTRFFGMPTAGFITANQKYDLPDGAKIWLAVTATADRNHKVHAQRLMPDEVIKSEPRAGTDQTIEAAKAWLMGK